MTAQPKRRWFRFGLRTLFAVVTLAACMLGWLVWQIQIVRERQAVLSEISRTCAPGASDELRYLDLDLESLESSHNPVMRRAFGDREYARVSRIRRLLDDKSLIQLKVPPTVDARLIERMENAFPESELAIGNSLTVGISIDFSNPYQPPIEPFRDSLFKPPAERRPNIGNVFKTGLIEK